MDDRRTIMNELFFVIGAMCSVVVLIAMFLFLSDCIEKNIKSKNEIEMAKLGYEQTECVGSPVLKWVKVKEEDK
jgi:hypothetical protein